MVERVVSGLLYTTPGNVPSPGNYRQFDKSETSFGSAWRINPEAPHNSIPQHSVANATAIKPASAKEINHAQIIKIVTKSGVSSGRVKGRRGTQTNGDRFVPAYSLSPDGESDV